MAKNSPLLPKKVPNAKYTIHTQPTNQGCTKSGILVTGLQAKHIFGSQFIAVLEAHPAKIICC